MKIKKVLFLTAIVLVSSFIIYNACLGLGVIITKSFKINLENGCYDHVIMPNQTSCPTGMYRCTANEPFNFYLICPIYGSFILVIVFFAGLVYGIYKCTRRSVMDYTTPYAQVLEWD